MKPLFPNPRVSKLRLGIMASTMLTTMSIGYADLALAQDDDESLESLEEVVVTGSRIRRQDFTANSPIVTVDENTFEDTSTIGLDTVLNQLPQFIPGAMGSPNGPTQQQTGTGGSQFAAGGIGPNAFQTPGTSSVNLRGLGAGRNLVLLDGRRGMPVDASMTVDLNSIPSSALERIEVVSGGASAVYGADAIAGAVNFILKDNFEGLDIRTNYGITELGDAEEYRVSALFGANTADGRGNVMLGLEHSHRGEGDYWERDWYRELREAPTVGSTDFFYSDTYVDGLLNGTTVWDWPNGTSETVTAPHQQAAIDGIFNQIAPGTIPGSAAFYLNKDGSLYTGAGGLFGANQREGAYRYNGPLTVDGKPFRKVDPLGGISQNQMENWVSVPLDRYSLFARGKYEVTDYVTAFANITMARSKTATESQYTPAVGGWNASIPHGSGIYADSFADPSAAVTGYDPVTGAPMYNPDAPTAPGFLSGGAMGLDCPATGGCTNTQAFPVPAELATLLATRSDPNAPFEMNRVLDFLGVRGSRNTTMNYQFQAGLEGEMDNGFYWDAAVSYGESENNTKVINYGNLERYRGVVQSANYGRQFERTGNAQGDGFSAGTAYCTSGLPIFEQFAVTDDCVSTISTTLFQSGIMEQSTFDANLGGDLLEMPAGPLQFAAGLAWRSNEYSFKTSDDLNGSNFHYSVIGLQPVNGTNGEIKVREIYAELLVPLVSDGPMGMRSFNLELGGRYSDYYTTAGGVETYKALGDWLITDWMRFRGGWQRATRAPNIRELFLGRTQDVFGSTTAYGDVCSLNNFESEYSAATGESSTGVAAQASAAQAAQTLAMCQAMMTDAGRTEYYDRPIDDMTGTGNMGGLYITGNRDVKPETADTLTAGLVMTSPFEGPWLQGLTLSLDWYQIELENMIAQDLAGTIVERCFSVDRNPTADLNNASCQLITRDPSDGSGNTLDVAYSNETGANLSGLDMNLNWNAQFAELGLDFIPGGIGINMLATFPLTMETQSEPGAEFLDWVGYQAGADCPSGVSCNSYDYTMFTTFNYFNGPWNASLRWQHYPDIKSGALVTNPDSTAKGVHSSFNVFALTAGYRLSESIMLTGGIENLFDKTPPLSGGNPDATPFPSPAQYTSGGIYDPLGRRFFISANLSF